MQAIILAAGMGKRLKELTEHNTKCMVKVNGVTLIERMLYQLERLCLNRIVLVVGYEKDNLIKFTSSLQLRTPIQYIENPIYDRTNNIYSLSLAKTVLAQDDTLLLESDIIFEDAVLDSLIDDPRKTLALVDRYEPWMDGTCVRLDEQDRITDFISGRNFDFQKTFGCYKTVNIYKFSQHFSREKYIPFLEAYQKALGENEYYEQVLRVISMLDNAEILGKRLDGQKWYEIDDKQDLDIASTLFCKTEENRAELISSRYGGYWRFPKMLDFCYLVNPYFPPQKMKDEMKASFDTLLTQYPSGQKVLTLLASKNYGIQEENIIVGNGAAELIKALMERLSGKIGFIRPTFEEYPNRYREEDSIFFMPENKDYHYTADDVIAFYKDKGICALILVNPDNPSGNYIEKREIARLIMWCKEKEIAFILDESFADFADEEDNSLIRQEELDANRNLFLIKSISKSYGVPGLRLGILASGNCEIISAMKKDSAIWNINSFAEFYLQIAEKYQKDYKTALQQFRSERKWLADELSRMPQIRVVPSQANYFMIELRTEVSAKELRAALLNKHHILIKDLSEKLSGRQYVRIAIRNHADNKMLLRALQEEL